MMQQALLTTDRWSQRRRRAEELKERWPFAAEVLAFYTALLDVQERAFAAAQERPPDPAAIAAFAAEQVLPGVIEVSVTSGPPALMAAVLECFHDANLKEVVRRWLRGGDELSAVERFLARAAAGPVLEAEGRAAGDACEGPRSERHCPTCGGLPQLSYFAPSPDNLVTAHRYLECARCATSWAYPRLTCAACGERESGRLRIFGEVGTAQAESSGNVVKPGAVQGRPAAGTVTARFPHLRIDGCGSCSRYLLNVDLERDGRAVPTVDEIAAIPLDLYAKERGLSKVVPNLMGF